MKNIRPDFDKEIVDIADYVLNYQITNQEAYQTAYYDLLDSLACAFMALKFNQCTKLLGPIVPGASLTNGACVPGTNYQLEPVQAAFSFGSMIRWLDFNDTWLAAEWGHPSDNLGGILMLADYLNRQKKSPTFTIQDILGFMIKAHEIQGVIALENSFNRVGLDHVLLVKLATAAVATSMLGGNKQQLCNAISLVWVDGQSLRTYRHAPNTGSRKSWAAGDATSRGVRLALMAMTGEMGYPSALTAPTWGFYDVSFKGKKFTFTRSYESYVMENVLFKIAFPAEFHAQTAVECAFQLHKQTVNKLNEIEKILVETQEAGVRIISKQGPLYNPADRDHCLEYMIAIGLIFGNLTAEHYENETAKDPRIDELRAKMQVKENSQFSKDYLDPQKRSIANSIQIFFKGGTHTDKITVEYPIGHRRRRKEGIPLLLEKFSGSVNKHFEGNRAKKIIELCENQQTVCKLPVDKFVDTFFLQEK